MKHKKPPQKENFDTWTGWFVASVIYWESWFEEFDRLIHNCGGTGRMATNNRAAYERVVLSVDGKKIPLWKRIQ